TRRCRFRRRRACAGIPRYVRSWSAARRARRRFATYRPDLLATLERSPSVERRWRTEIYGGEPCSLALDRRKKAESAASVAHAIFRAFNGRGSVVESFVKVVLYTGRGGRAKFREENVPLSEGTPQAMLSSLFPSSGFQLRRSPVGFRSPFHCT